MTDPYSTTKLSAYPDVVRRLRETGEGELLTVHLMPQNLCNHSCEFCSYRMVDNKNSEAFDEGKHLPWDDMRKLLFDLYALNVRGIELTGGGEPLAYPDIRELLAALGRFNFAVGLVTNGTLLDRVGSRLGEKDAAVELLAKAGLRWARVSVDAGRAETYARTRQAPEAHFERAWETVWRLSRAREEFHAEFKVGVGFVLTNENISEVYEFVAHAKESGADNVRLSLTFADSHLDYFRDKVKLKLAVGDSVRAEEDFSDKTFAVHNMIPTRYWEQEHPTQKYKRCPTKDVLCVVEGEGKVYSCCTFTGSKRGLYGNILEHELGFAGVWKDSAELRKNWDARVECQVACLYRDRNLAMNRLIDAPDPIHKEFI